MGFFNRNSTKKSYEVNKLSIDEKYIVEEMLDEGKKPREVAEEAGLPYAEVYKHYLVVKKREERKGSTVDPQDDIEKVLDKAIRIKQKQSILRDLADPDDLDELDLDDDVDPNNSLMTFLTALLNRKQGSPSSAEAFNNTDQEKVVVSSPDLHIKRDLTDKEIRSMIKQIKQKDPASLEVARTTDPARVKKWAENNFPDLSDQTIDKALVMIQNG